MLKNSLKLLESTNSPKTVIDRTNQIIDLANSNFITTVPATDTRGNVILEGQLTATNLYISNDGILEADELSTVSGTIISSNSPISVTSETQKILELKNPNGPVIKFTAGANTWTMGFENNVSKDFSMEYNNVEVFSIKSDTTSTIEATSITFDEEFTAPFFIGDATGNANTFTNGMYVVGNQVINGTKTFTENVEGEQNFSGELVGTANTATDAVYTTGVQFISGLKTFTNPITVTETVLFNGSNEAILRPLALKAERTITTIDGLTGGGNLTADRTISLTGQSLTLHQISSNGVLVRGVTDTIAPKELQQGAGVLLENVAGVSGNPKVSAWFSTQAETLAGISSTKVINPFGLSRLAENITGEKWLGHFGLPTTPSGIAYGNSQFVACISGTGAERIMTSPNGIVWKQVTTPNTNSFRSIVYANNIFVAVGDSGTGNRVMTSSDGFIWTARTSAANNDWQSVTYGNGLFVAVANTGTGNRIMTSPDGITWTIRTSPTNNNWRSVTYGNGLFVAVANSGTLNRVMTSPNGITWTSRTSAGDIDWRSVTFANGIFVAVAASGVNNRVMTSTNGINWTIRTSAANNNWQSVTWGNGLFVAVANSGTGDRIMTSTDGINWTLRSSPFDAGWKTIAYGNGKFVALADSAPPSPFSTEFRAMTSIV